MLDVFRIMASDGVIVLVGYAAAHLASKSSGDADPIFFAIRTLSHGLFLLLFTLTVGYHVVEFYNQRRNEMNSEQAKAVSSGHN
jgi:hypothetical protein